MFAFGGNSNSGMNLEPRLGQGGIRGRDWQQFRVRCVSTTLQEVGTVSHGW